MPGKSKSAAENTVVQTDPAAALPNTAAAPAKLYNPFQVSALRSGLPVDILQRPARGWPVLQNRPLSQLRWVGMLSTQDRREGLLSLNGLAYSVHIGDHIGQD